KKGREKHFPGFLFLRHLLSQRALPAKRTRPLNIYACRFGKNVTVGTFIRRLTQAYDIYISIRGELWFCQYSCECGTKAWQGGSISEMAMSARENNLHRRLPFGHAFSLKSAGR